MNLSDKPIASEIQMAVSPAPLDLGRLELDAHSAAAKHVANLLSKPEQLDKVDQYKRQVARKKASVEAMLKTAVQSQLDGVRTGLNHLQSALHDVYEIKQSLDQMDEAYQMIHPLHKSLNELMDENTTFCQLSAARENMKHIFTVPESVLKTRELISDGKLLQAHKHLTDLEMSRDDLLLELHHQSNKSPTDRNTLNMYFSEVEELSKELGKQLWVILQRILISVRREPTLIVTTLRIIEREERMDLAWKKKEELTGFMPPDRPKAWRTRCFKVLEESIAARVEGSQLESRVENKMWLVRHLEILRQLMIDDLKVVKTLLPPVCPPEYNVVQTYTSLYHTALSQQPQFIDLGQSRGPEIASKIFRSVMENSLLQELVSQELDGNEIVSLLQWVGLYDSTELMRHPDINLDVKLFGPLLDQSIVCQLHDQYLTVMRQNITAWSRNTLSSDVKDWAKDLAPDVDGDGYYNTPLPVIIFQMMEQNLQVAQILGHDLVRKVLELFTEELTKFAHELHNEVKLYQERHLADREEPKFYVHYMIATVNNCLRFGEFMRPLRRRYLYKDKYEEDDVSEDDTESIRKDRFQQLTDDFKTIGNVCCELLLIEVFVDLRESNALNELMTRHWMASTNAIDTICATWVDYAEDFAHVKPAMFEFMVRQGQRRILCEYLRAVLSRKLSFKNYDERRHSAEKICKEAEQIKKMFQDMAPKLDTAQFDVLLDLSEVLRLRDASMLALELSGFAQKYPDIRAEQMINLILCRTDISRSDAKQLAQDTVGQVGPQVKTGGIFTDLASW